jgi:hypothetical protein
MHYADHKERVFVEIGALLNPQTIAPLTFQLLVTKRSKAVSQTRTRMRNGNAGLRAKPANPFLQVPSFTSDPS